MAHSYTKLLVTYILLLFVYGNYPPNGTYLYQEESEGGFFGIDYEISFPFNMPHMVSMYIDCWPIKGLKGYFPLKEYDVLEGCSLDLRDYYDAMWWDRMTILIAAGARAAGRTLNKGDLETLITGTDSRGNTYIELTFNATKLHLRRIH
ncbi:hypothetical protein FOL47_009220 [Perkinsus chesapeaki]|uniref:Uncharacterized protein n=1 Tax=Perkinsus chesapeaki TaxID=330153 RepID=A0A7J6L9U3_PERCH|nr:hypothetical protein FOL47_009220 [Perkinsus chesapeaki]